MNNKEKLVLNECLAVGYFEGQSMGVSSSTYPGSLYVVRLR